MGWSILPARSARFQRSLTALASLAGAPNKPGTLFGRSLGPVAAVTISRPESRCPTGILVVNLSTRTYFADEDVASVEFTPLHHRRQSGLPTPPLVAAPQGPPAVRSSAGGRQPGPGPASEPPSAPELNRSVVQGGPNSPVVEFGRCSALGAAGVGRLVVAVVASGDLFGLTVLGSRPARHPRLLRSAM